MVGELLAQMTNQGVDVWHAGPVAAFVEEEVVRWLCDLVGYGAGSFGLLTSGGVMANFMGMALARDVHLGRLLGAGRPPRGAVLEGVRVYASDQTHFSIARALDVLGFPPETLVVVPSDERFRLRGAPVAEAIARDRAAGLTPFAIAAVAGSTNTGSVDARRRARRRRRAPRACGSTSTRRTAARPGCRPATPAACPDLERADSVTVDPHKWFFQAYDIGGLLVRDGAHLATTFGGRAPEYYRGGEAPVARHRRRRRPTTTTPTSSTSTSSASRAPAAGGRSSCGCPGSTSARAASRRLIEANDDLAALPRPPLRRGRRLRGRSPRPRSCRSSASATCPAAARPRRHAARRARRPPGPAPARARGLGRRLADDDPAARRDLAARRDRELPHDRGRHRPPARDAAPPRGRGEEIRPSRPSFAPLVRESPFRRSWACLDVSPVAAVTLGRRARDDTRPSRPCAHRR